MSDELQQDALFERVSQIINDAKSQVARTVNTAMVHAYWFIGRAIVEHEQGGEERAAYGELLIKNLSKRLTERFGKGFSYPNVKRMKQFYLAFPNGSALPLREEQKGSTVWSLFPTGAEDAVNKVVEHTLAGVFPPLLSWSHYRILMRLQNLQARAFYEIEAASEAWSVRELERQIGSKLFERLAASKDKEQVQAMAQQGQEILKPADIIKDPFVLEFLGLEEASSWLESDLEQAILSHLESFLLELGKGFCFVARQRRITLDGDHFYVDLVFYNRLLRCFVLIDLKLGKLTHQDLGQMQMYVNYYDRFKRLEDEAPTVGIVLCSDKNDAMVRITLPTDNAQIYASRYQLYLPTEEELRQEVVRQRERVELARGLAD